MRSFDRVSGRGRDVHQPDRYAFDPRVVVAVIAVGGPGHGGRFRRPGPRRRSGHRRMQEIGNAVEEGAAAYLARQFKTLSVFVVIVFVLLLALPADTRRRALGPLGLLRPRRGVLAAIGYLGMSLATEANVRVAAAAPVRRP